MATKTTSEMIAVMQAYMEGKAVQFCNGDFSKGWIDFENADWHDFHDGKEPYWDWFHHSYRVKPEPREWWIVPEETHLFSSKEGAQQFYRRTPPFQPVLVREVLE